MVPRRAGGGAQQVQLAAHPSCALHGVGTPGVLMGLCAVGHHAGAFLRFFTHILGLGVSFQDNPVSWKQVPVMAFLTSRLIVVVA